MTLLQSKAPSDATPIRYQDDAYSWAFQQPALMRADKLDRLDLEHLADEIADVAGREYNKLESALTRVIPHLLKWDHQAERRSRSWMLSIKEHRRRAARQLRKHPGLQGVLGEVTADAFAGGRYEALIDTGLAESAIPEINPCNWNDIMTRDIGWAEE